MERSAVMTDPRVLIASNCIRGMVIILLAVSYFLSPVNVSAQQSRKDGAKVPAADANASVNQQGAIAQLFGIVNELKGESDRPAAAILQSEVADVLWRFEEPAARAIFRLALDTLRQSSPNKSSSTDSKAKGESRRWTSAIQTILKRYGLHDRKGAEAWLKNLEDEIKADETTSRNGSRMSQEQAELLAEMALGLVSQDPKEALRLGLLSLSADETPSAFSRLLMTLRSRDQDLGDVLLRQAILVMRARGFKYDPALLSLTNYAFFANGSTLPGISPADAQLISHYFVDAASAQAARWRSGGVRDGDEQAAMGSLYSFLTNRALPIVALNSPDQLALLQTNIGELAQGLSPEQREQAEMLASLSSQRADQRDGQDSDMESRIRRIEREKNAATRDFLWRSLVLQLMRSDPTQALSLAGRIDDQEMRALTEDDVFLVLMQKAFANNSYDEARVLALKFNDTNRRARWLAQIASRVSPRSKDHTETADLLSQAYSIAAKSDNNPAKLEVLLLIAKEFVGFDRERGFDALSNAVSVANRLDAKTESKPKSLSGPIIRVTSISVVGGKEVSNDDRSTVNTIDFNQISAFAERDYVRTSGLGGDIKDHLLRAKYFIALARSILHIPRQGSGYERTLEEMLSN